MVTVYVPETQLGIVLNSTVKKPFDGIVPLGIRMNPSVTTGA
jgi:hypothetical protein